jgi:uncharacterized protein (TIGR03086 family)
VADADLDAPTPCADTSVGDLLDHIGGLTLAFTAAARKTVIAGATAPRADAAQLGEDWRTRIPGDLAALAEAWRDPAAWEGTTTAGGFEMPGSIAGRVALDELVIHAWDLARATGQPYEPDAASVEAGIELVAPSAEPGREAERAGMFGPVIPVPDDASPLERLIGLSGRSPSWTPAPGAAMNAGGTAG